MGHRCQQMKESYVKMNVRSCDSSTMAAAVWARSSVKFSLLHQITTTLVLSAHPACLVWAVVVAPQTSSLPLQGQLFPCKQWTATSQPLSNHPTSQSPSGSMSIHPHCWNRHWWISSTMAKYVHLSTFIINYLLTIPWFLIIHRLSLMRGCG